jgi:hypothetical protein
MVDNTGDPLVEATYAEAMAKLWGLQSAETGDYYDVMATAYSDVSGTRKEKKLKEIAKTYYDNLSKRVAFFADEMPETLDQVHFRRLEEAIQAENMILAALSPLDAQAVLGEFSRLLQRNQEVGKDRLISSIARAAVNNQYGDSFDFILNRLRNSSLLTEPDDEQGIRDIYDFMTQEQLELEQSNAE